MTAIPPEHDPSTLVLICDSCGRSYGNGESHTAWYVLWAHALGQGWRGRDRAIGPHSCVHCTG